MSNMDSDDEDSASIDLDDYKDLIDEHMHMARNYLPFIYVQHLQDIQVVRLYVRQLTVGCCGADNPTEGSKEKKKVCKEKFCASSEWFKNWTRTKQLNPWAIRQIAWKLAATRGHYGICEGISKWHAENERNGGAEPDIAKQEDEEEPDATAGDEEGGDKPEATLRKFISFQAHMFSPTSVTPRRPMPYYSGPLLNNLTVIDDVFVLRCLYDSSNTWANGSCFASLLHIFAHPEKLRECMNSGPEMFRLVFRLTTDVFPDSDSEHLAEVVHSLACGMRLLISQHECMYTPRSRNPHMLVIKKHGQQYTAAELEFMRGSTSAIVRATALASLMLHRYVAQVVSLKGRATVEMSAGAAFHALWSPCNGMFRVLFVEIMRAITLNPMIPTYFTEAIEGDMKEECMFVLACWARAYMATHWPRGTYSTTVSRSSSLFFAMAVWHVVRARCPRVKQDVLPFRQLGDLTPKTIFTSRNTTMPMSPGHGARSKLKAPYVHVLEFASLVFTLKARVGFLRSYALRCMVKAFRTGVVKSTLISIITSYYPGVSDQHLRSAYQRLDQRPPGVPSSRDSLQHALADYVQLYFLLDVSREDVLGSVFAGMRPAIRSRTMLSKPLKVRFGTGEDGVDHGGVQVEMFRTIGRMLCDPDYGLFEIDPDSQRAWFNKGFFDDVDRFDVVGTIVALAVYNGCTISVSFPKAMYMMLRGEFPTQLDEIKDLFPSLYHGLKAVLEYKGDVSELELVFEYTYQTMDRTITVPMREKPTRVTNANKADYVKEYIHWATFGTIEPFADAFKRGWSRLIPDCVTDMFEPDELMELVQGREWDAAEFSVEELKEVARYEDGYTEDTQVIIWFWDVVGKLSDEEKRQLLEFVTASERLPVVAGISGVRFVIQRNGPDSERLPTSLTCFGRLLLPEYSSRKKVERMLKTAIRHCKGFGLV